MMRLITSLGLCLMLACVGFGAIAGTVDRAPLPVWALDEPVPAADPAQADHRVGGVDYRLVDTQIRWQPGLQENLYRTVFHVESRSGLEEAARITKDFDPAHERLVLHHVRLKRDGVWIDVTDRIHFELLRRETDLEDSWMIDGHLTALAYIPDVRVGDLVDTAVSWVETPIIAKSHVTVKARASWGVPVSLARLRVIGPPDREIQIRQTDSIAPPRIERSEEALIHEWRTGNIAPVESERHTPAWHNPNDRISISSMRGWEEVVDDILPLYSEIHALPASFAAELNAALEGAQTPLDRMSRALHLVQNRIRYVGIELGDGAYHPRPPELTVARGYGDCKDKSVLLITALRSLGIEAYPVLAHTSTGHGIDPGLPTPYVFNHILVAAEIDGKTYWLDPTLDHQGGAGGHLVRPDYGLVLPLRPGQDRLVKIPEYRTAGPEVDVTETFRFDQSAGADLEVTSVFSGPAAEWRRRDLAHRSPAEYGRTLTRYYDDHYPGIEALGLPGIDDNRALNRLVVTERYRLEPEDLAADGLIEEFPLRAETVINYLPEPETRGRKYPIALRYPMHRRHKVILIDAPNQLGAADPYRLQNPWFDFSMHSHASGHRLTVSWTLLGLTDQVAAEDAATYLDAVAEVEDLATWWWTVGDLPDTSPAASEPQTSFLEHMLSIWEAARPAE